MTAGSTARSPLTALYVPGSRPDRFDKAVASGTDVVILDLEDAVSPADKATARRHVVDWLSAHEDLSAVRLQVRVNPLATPWGAVDLAAIPVDVPIRLPKVESVSDVDAVGPREVHCLVESARGLLHAAEIASHPQVATMALGEADLAADLGITDERALSVLRTQLVIAARAADLPAPMMSVYPAIRDLDGLAGSCAAGRAVGMRGRAAIHPAQLPVIASAFAPSRAERDWADAVLSALEDAGGGVAVLSSGAMVDAAMARRARELLAGG